MLCPLALACCGHSCDGIRTTNLGDTGINLKKQARCAGCLRLLCAAAPDGMLRMPALGRTSTLREPPGPSFVLKHFVASLARPQMALLEALSGLPSLLEGLRAPCTDPAAALELASMASQFNRTVDDNFTLARDSIEAVGRLDGGGTTPGLPPRVLQTLHQGRSAMPASLVYCGPCRLGCWLTPCANWRRWTACWQLR